LILECPFHVNATTNGFLVERFAKDLASAGLNRVTVSLVLRLMPSCMSVRGWALANVPVCKREWNVEGKPHWVNLAKS